MDACSDTVHQNHFAMAEHSLRFQAVAFHSQAMGLMHLAVQAALVYALTGAHLVTERGHALACVAVVAFADSSMRQQLSQLV